MEASGTIISSNTPPRSGLPANAAAPGANSANRVEEARAVPCLPSEVELAELLGVKLPKARQVLNALLEKTKDGLIRQEWNGVMDRFGFYDLKMNSDAFAALGCGVEDSWSKSEKCFDLPKAIKRMAKTTKTMQRLLGGTLRQVLAKYAQYSHGFKLVDSSRQIKAVKGAFDGDIEVALSQYPRFKEEIKNIKDEDKKWEFLTFQVIFPTIFIKIGLEEGERPLGVMNELIEKIEEDEEAFERYKDEIRHMAETGIFDYKRVIYGNKPRERMEGEVAKPVAVENNDPKGVKNNG